MDVREKLEVIAYLGDHISYKEDIGICYDSALAKVIEDAYMDLKNGVTVQEQDGCEYCKHSESVYHNSSGIHDSMDEDVYISGNNIVVDIGCHSCGTAEIKFCPMCGRRLPQPPKGE